jgi:hypothetical protein
MSMNTTKRTPDTDRMISNNFNSSTIAKGTRHYATRRHPNTQACDGRTLFQPIVVSSLDEHYRTCVRCIKLTEQPVENPNASIDAAIARLADAIENPNTVAGLDAHAASITLTALIDARTILMTRRIQGSKLMQLTNEQRGLASAKALNSEGDEQGYVVVDNLRICGDCLHTADVHSISDPNSELCYGMGNCGNCVDCA